MSDDLEKALRAALRPVDPGDSFTARVLSQLPEVQAPSTGQVRTGRWRGQTPVASRWPRPAVTGGWLALAASLLLAWAGAHLYHAHRVQQGLLARQQLLEALRVTGRKLDVVYRAVNDAGSTPKPPGV